MRRDWFPKPQSRQLFLQNAVISGVLAVTGRICQVTPVVAPPSGETVALAGLVVGAVAPSFNTSPPTCRRVRAIARPGRHFLFLLKDNG